MRLIVIDQTEGNSGYSIATRKTTEAIAELGVPVVWHKKGQINFREGDILMGRLYFQDLKPYYGKCKIVAWLTLESTKLPEQIVREANSNFIDQIWCPSTFCKQNYINSGVIEDKIRVIPHGVDTEIFHPTFKKNDKFTFVFVGGYTGKGDRKGADILCKAFAEEFAKDDVELYLKINTVYGNASHELEQIAGSVRDKITINTLSVSEEEMNNIYNLGHVFVSPSKAEGFNMTILEAMAVGLPVITTNWGGQMDYIPRKFEQCMDAVKPIPARWSPWDVGEWRDFEIQDLRERMRIFYENGDAGIGKINLRVAGKYSWKNSAKKAIEALKSM